MPRAIPLMAALALGLALTGPAQAAFNVCNKTGMPTRVALGRFDGVAWTSQGWWNIAPKTCVGLLTGPLQARYYYLYATDGALGLWQGKTRFCAAAGVRFLAQGRQDCAARHMEQLGFFEVDTGKAADWTQNLSN